MTQLEASYYFSEILKVPEYINPIAYIFLMMLLAKMQCLLILFIKCC